MAENRSIKSGLGVILLFILFSAVAFSQEEKKTAEYLLRGIFDTRKSWVSGKVRLTGKSFNLRNNSERKIDVTITFDTTRSSFRYDIVAGGPAAGGVYIKTGEEQIEYIDEGGSVAVIKGPQEGKSGFVFSPDIHAIGLLPVQDFLHGVSLEEFQEVLDPFEFHSLEENEGLAIIRLTRPYEGGYFEFAVSVDDSRDFSVVECSNGVFDESQDSFHTAATISTHWQEIGGEYLPVKYESKISGYDAIVNLDWIEFNVPISATVFEADSIPMRKGTLIEDKRIGDGVIIGKAGVPDYLPPPVVEKRPGHVLLLLTGLVLFGIIVVILKRLRT